MTNSTLPFKQQQNIAQSHFSPFITVLGKKVGQLKIDAMKFPVNEFQKENATNRNLF